MEGSELQQQKADLGHASTGVSLLFNSQDRVTLLFGLLLSTSNTAANHNPFCGWQLAVTWAEFWLGCRADYCNVYNRLTRLHHSRAQSYRSITNPLSYQFNNKLKRNLLSVLLVLISLQCHSCSCRFNIYYLSCKIVCRFNFIISIMGQVLKWYLIQYELISVVIMQVIVASVFLVNLVWKEIILKMYLKHVLLLQRHQPASFAPFLWLKVIRSYRN